MTALTEAVKAAIEARLQVARAAQAEMAREWWLWVNTNIASLDDPVAAHIAAGDPSVVALSCEADLAVLTCCEVALPNLDPYSVAATWVKRFLGNLATRYGVSDGD